MRSRRRTVAVATVALIALVLVAGASGAGRTDPVVRALGTAQRSVASSPSAVERPPTTALTVPLRPAGLDQLPADTAPPAPVGLTIGRLGVEVPVDPVGVQDDGQMEIPPLAERAGWYRYGAAPGDPDGTVVIAAHVDSVASAGLGPFSRLSELAAGDLVDVQVADGGSRRYAVVSVVSVPKTDAVWDQVFTRAGDHRLVLVTCGGTFVRSAASYSDNVVVTAEPVGG